VANLLRTIALTSALFTACPVGLCARAPIWQRAIDKSARAAPDARIVVVEVKTGGVLGAYHLAEAARTLAAPGSTLKPLILYRLLSTGRWIAGQRVACSRQLDINGRRLACSHPPGAPFDAREALAWSCNSYFAAVARSLRPGELGHMLRPTGLFEATGTANAEGQAEFHEPRTQAEGELAVLGVEGVRVTPLGLAGAYRWLARELATHAEGAAAVTVQGGLSDSASFGMAGEASQGGVPVAGKTGTAQGAHTHQTHGWFAGMAPAAKPTVVIVVYLPTGRGSDAARVAGMLLKAAQADQQ
jgi:penicillin-binding protein A